MLIAVYGTLKRGYSNHHLIQDAIYVKTIRIPGVLVCFPYFPGMILHDDIPEHHPARRYCCGSSTRAEVYSIDSSLLGPLDHLEGHPNFYCRKTVKHGNLDDIQVYTLPAARYIKGVQQVIRSGEWLASCTTIQEVDFGDGTVKPRIIGWSSNNKKNTWVPGVSLGTKHDEHYSEWTDGTDEYAETVIDLSPEYELQVVDIDSDLSAFKEAP